MVNLQHALYTATPAPHYRRLPLSPGHSRLLAGALVAVIAFPFRNARLATAVGMAALRLLG